MVVNIYDTECKRDDHRIRRYNSVLQGINRIFSIVIQAKTEEELGNACLSVAIDVTGSRIGFIGEVGADGLLHDIAISDIGWAQCKMYDRTGHRRPPGNFILHGLYGRVIDSGKGFFTNEPSSHPDSIGLPQGHPPLTSVLGVPLVLDEKIVGMISVANREGGYSYEQQEDLEAIASAVIQALHRKREEQEREQAEEALKKVHEDLEEKIKERTAELEKSYNSLKESEKRLSEAQKMAHLGSWERDIATDEIYWSDEAYRIYGLSPQELRITYNMFLSFVHPGDRDYVDNTVKKALDGKPYSIDFRIISVGGIERIVHSQGEVIFDEQNKPVRAKGTVQDITEQKKAEEKIQSLANIVESSNDAVITESLDGIITSWNKAAEQIYGYSAEEIMGKSVSILEPDTIKGEIKQLIEKVKQGDKIQRYETLRLKKDGTIINVSITLSPIFNMYRELVAISAIVRDITDRKKAENTLLKIETARKKEIHHRIKNNLQVISSLLDLQAGKFNNRECVKDSEILEAFRESQDRVISIALIHEELHETEGTDTLDFSPYLEKLLGNLFHTYRLGNVDISLKTDLEENIFFNMDIAVPLGMIVNELVSNSLKYAFPDRETGEIQIKLFSEKSENKPDIKKELPEKSTGYTLVISDDGASIPEEIDFENPETLGLQLVKILVDQLDGEIELEREHGTEFIIRFSVEEKEDK